MPDTASRVDDLVKATKAWAKTRREALEKRVTSSKAILRGRTGQERLAQSSVQAASVLVVNEISSFLAP